MIVDGEVIFIIICGVFIYFVFVSFDLLYIIVRFGWIMVVVLLILSLFFVFKNILKGVENIL